MIGKGNHRGWQDELAWSDQTKPHIDLISMDEKKLGCVTVIVSEVID